MYTGFWWEYSKEKFNLEDMDMLEDNIKVGIKETGWECVDQIHVPRDRDKWEAVVNVVMNLWIHKMQGIFFDQLRNCQFLKKKETMLHELSHSDIIILNIHSK